MADHVFGVISPGDALDAIEQFCGFGKTRSLAVRQIDLGGIAVMIIRLFSPSRVRNIFICNRSGVLALRPG